MAMVKLIESSQFSDVPDIGAKFAEFNSPAMSKEAENVFGRSYDSLKPTDDKYVGIHLVALGDEEHYGCFFAGAPVTTPNGMKYIEEVEVGDEVVTHTGSIAKIAKVFKTEYTGVRADIDVNSLPDSISCTGVHPFLVVHRKGFSAKTRFDLRKEGNLAGAIDAKVAEAEWVKAAELVAGDYLVIPTSYTDEALARYPDIPADFDPYACGYYLADGCLTREYRDIASKGEYKGALLTGSMSKTKVFDRIDAWLHSIGRTVPTRGRSYTSDIGIRYEVYFKEWAEWLDSTFGHDGIVKHISPVVWKWSREDRLRFLAGYFDGDGCLIDSPGTRYHGTVSVNSASRGLLMDIQRLLASVGIASSVCRGMNRASNGCFGNGDHVIFALTIGAWYARELLKYTARLYPIEREFKQRGASSMQLGHKYALVRIGNVELSEVTATKYNFEVPGDNSYIVDVAVHNCNRNMDGFSKESCIRDHDTFVKHGHVFSHHHNDAEKDEILGAIKASAYNDKMGRIELFIWADKEKAAEGLDTLEKTGECAFSMATKVPYDECFPKGTLVQTTDGYKEIETIESGDFVISADGNKCRVVATSVRMASKITTVKAGGLPLGIRSTANHPYRVVRADIVHGCCGSVSGERRRHKFIGTNTCTFCHKTVGLAETWVAAGELTRHDYLAVDVPSCSEVDTVGPQFAYVAGQYTGDGSTISERRGRDGTGEINLMGISFSLSKAEKDSDITDRLTKATVAVCGEKPQLHADGDKGAWVAHLYDQSVAVRVVELVGAGSKTKRITDVVHRWSRREKIAFLSGLIDSDGCVSPEKGMTRVCTSSRSLALGVQQLCWSVGIPATCYVTTYGQSNEHSIRGVYFSSGVAYGVQFSTYVPELFEFSAKLARHLDITGAKRNAMRVMLACGRAYLPIDSVETHDADPIAVYNIEVEDDHTYNAEGAAVHNCSICGAKRKNSSDPNMCDHIRNQLGKMAEDGKIAYMRNVVNDWFDISFVTRPADRIAYSLKVADEVPDGVITSEMLAKVAGIEAPAYLDQGLVSDKRWTLRKLAEAYDDRIREAEATPMYRATAKVASSRIDDATIETLRKMPVKQAVAFLVDSGTFLGPDDFCRYAMGPKSAEYAEVGPRSAEIGAIAREIVKEAAWLDRFDLTSGGDFDCDRFTSRASRRFTDVAKADIAVKSASFSSDNILDLIAECGLETKKTAGAHIDTSDKMWFNTLDKPILAVALKYAEYKVAALNAALNGAASGGVPNTENREALLALVAAQDL